MGPSVLVEVIWVVAVVGAAAVAYAALQLTQRPAVSATPFASALAAVGVALSGAAESLRRADVQPAKGDSLCERAVTAS